MSELSVDVPVWIGYGAADRESARVCWRCRTSTNIPVCAGTCAGMGRCGTVRTVSSRCGFGGMLDGILAAIGNEDSTKKFNSNNRVPLQEQEWNRRPAPTGTSLLTLLGDVRPRTLSPEGHRRLV
jgi:hypothetical protein